MMSGPWSAKEYVTSFLKWDMPRRISGYRNLWQLDERRLPLPEAYHSYEPPAIDTVPMVITVQMSTTAMERSDYTDDLNPVYRVTYSMRTYLWVRQDSAEMVTETRDRLLTVIRSALLDRPCLTAGDVHNQHDLLIDEGSIREEYSDITYVKGDRAVAGGYISYDLKLYEAVVRDPIVRGTEENPLSVTSSVFPLPR